MNAGMGRSLVGFYGKLPGLGDFVQRRLRADFVEPWDRAFRVAVAGVAGRLGDGWRERFLAAPVWRFALAAHACGPHPWIGAVASSSDRVGRVFPLVLAISPAPAVDGWPRLPGSAWFDRLDAVLREGLDEGSLLDFDLAVSALPDPGCTPTDAFASPLGDTARSLWWRGSDPRSGVLLHGLPGEADYLRFIDGIDAENPEESL